MDATLDHRSAPAAPAGASADPAQQQAHRLGIVRHLIAAMMLGDMYGRAAEAKCVFDAIAAMLGDGRPLRISRAFGSAMGGDLAPARALLDEGLDDWPDPELSRLAVAMALKLGGDPLWEEIVKHTLAVSTNDDARRFAQQVQGMVTQES
jgi:hypothetical protein